MSDIASEIERAQVFEARMRAHRECNQALERQEGGSHYKSMGMEPLAFCAANMSKDGIRAVAQQNVLKYVWRDKGDVITDLKKARHYIDWAIETLEGKA